MTTEGARAGEGFVPKVARLLLGAVFAASAVLKLIDFAAFVEQTSYYGIVEEGPLLQVVAGAVVGLEVILALALLVRWRPKGVLALTALVLVGFTALIAYAWAFNDLDECGCFGSFFAMTPAVSIGKNLLLLLLVPAAWSGAGRRSDAPEPASPKPRSRTRAFVVGTIAGVILALVLEIAAFAAYAIFFRDRMIANLEKKMLAPSPPGTPMPYDWKIETLEDESVDMAAFEGKPLFLVFFSPSCPKCEAQLPGVQRLYDEVKGDGLAFVVVSTRDNEQLVPMLERRNCTFPVYTFGGKRPPLFKRVQVPSAYVFSPDGQLLYEQFDAARWDDPKFAAYLKSLMGSETAGEVKPS